MRTRSINGKPQAGLWGLARLFFRVPGRVVVVCRSPSSAGRAKALRTREQTCSKSSRGRRSQPGGIRCCRRRPRPRLARGTAPGSVGQPAAGTGEIDKKTQVRPSRAVPGVTVPHLEFAPGIINENAAHAFSRGPDKMGTVLPGLVRRAHQAQPRAHERARWVARCGQRLRLPCDAPPTSVVRHKPAAAIPRQLWNRLGERDRESV
jgi:hypothetical protein